MKTDKQMKWLNVPEDHNYPAAISYLNLIYDMPTCEKFVTELKSAVVTSFKAKDIFRASSLSLLGISNIHVKRDKIKIREGVALSPILLVRDSTRGKVIIADGYHRLCAVYFFDEDS